MIQSCLFISKPVSMDSLYRVEYLYKYIVLLISMIKNDLPQRHVHSFSYIGSNTSSFQHVFIISLLMNRNSSNASSR